MPALFDHLYREYCRARLAEMQKQLLISAKRHEVQKRIAMQGTKALAFETEPNSGQRSDDPPYPPQAR